MPGRREEQRLATLGQEGNQEALHSVIKSHLERTARLALQLAPPSLRPLDAIQEANLVLVRAAREGLWGPELDSELATRVATLFRGLDQG